MVRIKTWIGILAFLWLVITPGILQSQQTQQGSQSQQSSSTTADQSAQDKQAAGEARAKTSSTPKPRYYTNRAGQRVQSPTKASSVPAGATAQCRDGSYSFSQNHRGTCSHNGGVAKWL